MARVAASTMTRRRPTFAQYLRRRWRAVGLILVLLLGGVLVLAVTDRGHDPAWDARTGTVGDIVLSPDGKAAYALARDEGENARLEARSAEDGRVLWSSRLPASGALLRAVDDEVVVATDFPRAFLTSYGADGGIQWQVPLEGSPRALAIDGGLVALSLRASGNPVLVVEDGQVLRIHRFSTLVDSLDMRAGRLAVGTEGGELVVFDATGARVGNMTVPISVRSVRLDARGGVVVFGGSGVGAAALSGGVGVMDVGAAQPLRWLTRTTQGIGLVSTDRGADAVLALEAAPTYAVTLHDGKTGAVRWTRPSGDVVSRDDAGAYGGAALSPDGGTVVVLTLRGPVRALDGGTGESRWTYAAEGGTVVAFPRDDATRFATNARLVQNGPFDAVLLFLADGEPAMDRIGIAAAGLTLLAALVAALVVGAGFWRARRSW